jgi:ribulose-phosphate 3-epimerase
MIISVDGGVSLENAQDLISAGASRLVVGSAIFNSDNFIETLEKFKRIL